MYLIGNKKVSTLPKSGPALKGAPDVSAKTIVECRRSVAGVPLFVNGEVIDPKLVKDGDAIFGVTLGSPASQKARDVLINIPQRKYLIAQVLQAFRELTSLEAIVTSHDLSRGGGKRQNSEGHLNGFATDIIFVLTDADGNRNVVLDLMNSVAFLAYLRSVSIQVFPALQATATMWQGKPMIFGCEYDHLHIEWPWTERVLPSERSFLRIEGIPAGVVIGTFYNPQPQYGLSQNRAGDGDGALLIL